MLVLFVLILVILIPSNPYKNQIQQKTSQFNTSAIPNRYKITVNYPYNWIDASSGIELILGDDNHASTTLPFNFTFYDNSFTKLHIVTEGYLTFSFKSVQKTGTIPSSHPHQRNIIAPYWNNLDGNLGQIYIKNYSSYWIVAWENYHLDNGSFLGTFEAILYNNGDIVFNYDILANVSTYSCGLNYGDGVNYSSYNELFSGVNDFSIKFSSVIGGGNGAIDNTLTNIIIGVVVTLGAIAIIGGITIYYYRKNPEQFKARLSRGKAKIKEGISKLKEKGSKEKKRIKHKTPNNE